MNTRQILFYSFADELVLPSVFSEQEVHSRIAQLQWDNYIYFFGEED